MSNKNHNVYGTPEVLKALADEYRRYCGRDVKMESDRLVVLALPPAKPKKKKKEERPVRDDEDTKKPDRTQRPKVY